MLATSRETTFHENFTKDVSGVKNELVKFCESAASHKIPKL